MPRAGGAISQWRALGVLASSMNSFKVLALEALGTKNTMGTLMRREMG
jgi:hypothetical protein